MKLTRQILEAARHMRTAEMTPLVDYLREERQEILEQLSTVPTANAQVLQGRAQSLKSILDLVDGATKLIDKTQKV
jgi:hypothetical protein